MLNVLTILFILSQFFLLLLLTLNIWEVFPVDGAFSCDIIVICMVTLYHLSKSIFYFILITRLEVAFYLSSLKYSNVTVILLYLFVVVYLIFICVGTPFVIWGKWLTTPVTWYVHMCYLFV